MWDPYGMNGLDFNGPLIAMERILAPTGYHGSYLAKLHIEIVDRSDGVIEAP